MTLVYRIFGCIVFFASLSACSFLQRHPSSGYSDYGALGGHDNFFQKQQQYQSDQARQEIESERGYALNPEEQSLIARRLQVKELETQLRNANEKKQYYNYKHYLQSDQDRINFLSLPSAQAREQFANSRGLASARSSFSPQHIDMIDNKDITVGMNQEAVRQSWGDPDIVEIAGNPVYGNERWKYSKYVSSDAGYERQVRFVYFENGIVTGWETL
ncbi:MAG: hypothetical protein HRT45_02825 [Bdellovibrionales bacterium]|nr:hypothetical protein [Bdellovibrionales bacterium]